MILASSGWCTVFLVCASILSDIWSFLPLPAAHFLGSGVASGDRITVQLRRVIMFLSKRIMAFIACSAALCSQAMAQTSIVADDFEGSAQPWKFRVFFYEDAGCETVASGYPMYPPSNEAAADATVGPPNGSYNVSWTETGNDNAINGTSLVVADTDDTVDTAGGTQNLCHRVNVFREVATGSTDLGEGQVVTYTLSAEAKANRYGSNDATAEVGVYFQALDVNAGYSSFANYLRPVTPDASVSEEFTVDMTGRTNVVVLAGFYAQHDTEEANVQASWDDFDVSWLPDQTANNEAEQAACADTGTLDSGTLDWDDGFGGAEMTCLTDTYLVPAGSESYAGFGDGNEDDSAMYPLYFPDGGSITFDCSTESGSADVYFKLESNPYPNNDVDYDTATVTCSAGAARSSKSVSIPASEQVWNNLLLYVATEDQPVQIKEIRVRGSREYIAPIPASPLWAILGLIFALGFIGTRKRR